MLLTICKASFHFHFEDVPGAIAFPAALFSVTKINKLPFEGWEKIVNHTSIQTFLSDLEIVQQSFKKVGPVLGWKEEGQGFFQRLIMLKLKENEQAMSNFQFEDDTEPNLEVFSPWDQRFLPNLAVIQKTSQEMEVSKAAGPKPADGTFLIPFEPLKSSLATLQKWIGRAGGEDKILNLAKKIIQKQTISNIDFWIAMKETPLQPITPRRREETQREAQLENKKKPKASSNDSKQNEESVARSEGEEGQQPTTKPLVEQTTKQE